MHCVRINQAMLRELFLPSSSKQINVIDGRKIWHLNTFATRAPESSQRDRVVSLQYFAPRTVWVNYREFMTKLHVIINYSVCSQPDRCSGAALLFLWRVMYVIWAIQTSVWRFWVGWYDDPSLVRMMSYCRCGACNKSRVCDVTQW